MSLLRHAKAPSWAFVLSALGLFIYQSLDAIDGKQARRTNSSSALGELFDHGCDAVSTGAFTVMQKKTLPQYKMCFFYRTWSTIRCAL